MKMEREMHENEEGFTESIGHSSDRINDEEGDSESEQSEPKFTKEKVDLLLMQLSSKLRNGGIVNDYLGSAYRGHASKRGYTFSGKVEKSRRDSLKSRSSYKTPHSARVNVYGNDSQQQYQERKIADLEKAIVLATLRSRIIQRKIDLVNAENAALKKLRHLI